jgi:hypothetical protein
LVRPLAWLFDGYYRLAVWAATRVLGGKARALFAAGSVARGQIRPGLSDVDLVALVDQAATGEWLRRRYAILRIGFPILERALPIYTVEEARRYRQYLAPLLEPPFGQLLAGSIPEDFFADLGDVGRVTFVSDLWKRALQARNVPAVFRCDGDLARYEQIHVQGLPRTLFLMLPEPQLATIPPEGTTLHWQVSADLVRRARQLPWVSAVSVIPALDFFEDVPLAQMPMRHANVILYSEVWDVDLLAEWRAQWGAGDRYGLYAATGDGYLPLGGSPFDRIKTAGVTPLFDELARNAKIDLTHPDPESSPVFRVSKLGLDDYGGSSLAALNETFVRSALRDQMLFAAPAEDLFSLAAKFRLVLDGRLPSEAFAGAGPLGDPRLAEAVDYFESHAALTGEKPQPEGRTSVIVITRNRARSCVATLESLLAMSRLPDEIIVVDNGSTDDTAARLAGFGDTRVKYIREEVVGIPQARNAGLRAASGDIIAFCDDDCTVARDWLDALVMPFRYDAQIGCVGGLVRYESRVSAVNRFYQRAFRLSPSVGAK